MSFKKHSIYAVSLLVLLLIAACGPVPAAPQAAVEPAEEEPAAAEEEAMEEETEAEAEAEEEAMAEGPTQGGTVTYGQLGDIANFDPFQLSSVSYPMFQNLYDSLIRYDNALNIEPRLAESWELNEDSTQITLTLRQGVKWHNGRDFVADDVVKNFERGLSDEVGHNIHGTVNGVVDKVTAVDDHTVVIDFLAPTPNVFDILNTIFIHAPESMDSLENTAIGTGPFKLVEWIPGDHVTLERNDDYWEEGKPYLDGWTFTPYEDYEALLAAVQGGVIDIARNIVPKDVEFLEGQGLVLAPGQEGFILYTLTVNPPDPDQEPGPLSDKRVRCALNYAMDRDTIVDQALYGAGKRLVQNFPEWSIAYFPEYDDRYPFDLDKAKELLAEAGYPDGGFTLKAIVPASDPAYEAMAVIHQADLAQLGIELDIQVLDGAAYGPEHLGSPETNGSAPFDLDYTGVGRQHLDPMGLWSNSPYRHFNSPIFPREDFPGDKVELVTKAGQTVDPEERREIFKEIVELQLDQCTNLPVSWRYVFFATQPHVHDLAWDVEDRVIMADVWVDQ